MTLQEHIQHLQTQYQILGIVDLDPWHDIEDFDQKAWLKQKLSDTYRPVFEDNQRLIFTLSRGDLYSKKDSDAGYFIKQFQRRLNEIDISNYFVILITSDQTLADSYVMHFQELSVDPVPMTVVVCDPKTNEKMIKKNIQQPSKIRPKNLGYDQLDPLKIDLEDLSQKQQFLLKDSKRFCIYPWIHFHAFPTGESYPCCMADMKYPIGNLRKNSMREIWNHEPMRQIRRSMLNEQSVEACNRCYEKEQHGFVSGRQSANKHFGHYIDRVDRTEQDGTLDEMQLTYWDIRFSNLCNLRCRSCGYIFSSQWYQDQAAIAGESWKKNNRVLNYAGQFETDAVDQLMEHIDYVEQIYFAGGEPLLMEEHYQILDELVRRQRFDVRLIYNTNFTHTDLKGRSVFEYWKLFDSVSVGASLDAAGPRAEYIRKGTNWAVVEQNRKEMLAICPKVDFYISPTLSIMNALHLPDFHRSWVEQGLISPQDLNVNILQDPDHYRIDIAPDSYKQVLKEKFQDHIKWLEGQDRYGRATQGFISAVNFMMAQDNTALLPTFWHKTQELDQIRKENILDVIPELSALKCR